MQKWVGKSVKEVVADWGNPTYVEPDNQGGKVLIYEQVVDWNQVQGPSNGSRQPMFQRARKILFVNNEGKVYRWRTDPE